MDPIQLAALSKLRADIADTLLDEFYQEHSLESLHKLRLAIPILFERLRQARHGTPRSKIGFGHQHG